MKHLRLKDIKIYFFQKSLLIRCSIIFLLTCIILLIWFFLVFDKISNKISQINNEIITLKENKVLLDKLLKQKSENSETAFKLKKQIDTLYPNNLDLNQILNIANQSGLELVNYGSEYQIKNNGSDLDLNENENQSSNSSIKKNNANLVPLSFKGNFYQVLDFLIKNLENKKLYKFEDINILKFKDDILQFNCIFNCTRPCNL